MCGTIIHNQNDMRKEQNILPVDAYRALLERQEQEERRARRKAGHRESDLQRSCVAWFRSQYPEHAPLLFAVPNGGGRSKAEAGRMKAEGVVAGVSDLILLEARGGWGSLCLEMKTEEKGSRQSVRQREWQEAAEVFGNKYVVCRSLEDFMGAVNGYLALPMSVTGKTTKSVRFCGHTVAVAPSVRWGGGVGHLGGENPANRRK